MSPQWRSTLLLLFFSFFWRSYFKAGKIDLVGCVPPTATTAALPLSSVFFLLSSAFNSNTSCLLVSHFCRDGLRNSHLDDSMRMMLRSPRVASAGRGQHQFSLSIFFSPANIPCVLWPQGGGGQQEKAEDCEGWGRELYGVASRLSRSSQCGESLTEGCGPALLLVAMYFSRRDLLMTVFCFCGVIRLSIALHYA